MGGIRPEFGALFSPNKSEGDKSLRVQCVGHVDAVPPVRLDRTVDNVSGVGKGAQRGQGCEPLNEGDA
jgi:hypothetical protein